MWLAGGLCSPQWLAVGIESQARASPTAPRRGGSGCLILTPGMRLPLKGPGGPLGLVLYSFTSTTDADMLLEDLGP